MNYTRVSWGRMDRWSRRAKEIPAVNPSATLGLEFGCYCGMDDYGASWIINACLGNFLIYTRVMARGFERSNGYSYYYVGRVDAMRSTTDIWSPCYESH